MHKKVFGKKLSRNRRSRTALFRSLSKSMILHGKIMTTVAKAVAVQPDVEKLMSLVRKGTLADRRAALSILANDKEVTETLFKRYSAFANSRTSGFTRVRKLVNRRGDGAEMVSLEWVEEVPPLIKEPVKKAKKTKEKVEDKKVK